MTIAVILALVYIGHIYVQTHDNNNYTDYCCGKWDSQLNLIDKTCSKNKSSNQNRIRRWYLRPDQKWSKHFYENQRLVLRSKTDAICLLRGHGGFWYANLVYLFNNWWILKSLFLKYGSSNDDRAAQNRCVFGLYIPNARFDFAFPRVEKREHLWISVSLWHDVSLSV